MLVIIGERQRGMKLERLGIIFMLYCVPIGAEAFGNSAVNIPNLGMVFFDAGLNLNQKPWGINHQWTVGASYKQAIDYRWWWVVDSAFGIGALADHDRLFLSSFMGGAGLAFNIFEEDFRPYTGLAIHYLHLLGNAVKNMPLDLGWPIFIGFKPYFGMEWLFYSEMSIVLEGAYGFYVNLSEPFRHLLYASIAFAFYF